MESQRQTGPPCQARGCQEHQLEVGPDSRSQTLPSRGLSPGRKCSWPSNLCLPWTLKNSRFRWCEGLRYARAAGSQKSFHLFSSLSSTCVHANSLRCKNGILLYIQFCHLSFFFFLLKNVTGILPSCLDTMLFKGKAAVHRRLPPSLSDPRFLLGSLWRHF